MRSGSRCEITAPKRVKNPPASFFAVEFDQSRAELRKLAADLGVDLIVQDRFPLAHLFEADQRPHRPWQSPRHRLILPR